MGLFKKSGITCPDCGKSNRKARPEDRCSVCGGLLAYDGSVHNAKGPGMVASTLGEAAVALDRLGDDPLERVAKDVAAEQIDEAAITWRPPAAD